MAVAVPWWWCLDEAHHARRRGAGSAQEGGPNSLLRLMRGLNEKTQGLVLLTATPMQVHPVEVYGLLSLFGMPAEWSQASFLRFFEDIRQESPSHEAFDRLAGMFRAVEGTYGPVSLDAVHLLGVTSQLQAKKIVGALSDPSSIPRRRLSGEHRRVAMQLDTSRSPDVRGRDGRAAVGRALRGGISEIALLMDAFGGGMVARAAVSDPTPSRPCC